MSTNSTQTRPVACRMRPIDADKLRQLAERRDCTVSVLLARLAAEELRRAA